MASALAYQPFRPPYHDDRESEARYHQQHVYGPFQQRQQHQQQTTNAQRDSSHSDPTEGTSSFPAHYQQQQQQHQHRQIPSALSDREMLAAQQHFGYPMQQQQQGEGQSNDSTPSGGWNDDSESFLRNLLAQNGTSPHTSISGASGIGSSPGYIEDNRNSLSPGSSSGFQSLHDFIHNNGTYPTPPLSDASGYGGPGSNLINGKPAVPIQHQQHLQHQMLFPGGHEQAPHMDASALDFFVNSMVNGNDRPMMHSTSPGTGLDPSLVSPAYAFGQDAPTINFQPHLFGPQSMSGQPQHYTQMQSSFPPPQQQQQQQQMQEAHPALEGRKRSAPGVVMRETSTLSKANVAPAARNTKKIKTQAPASQALPNATPAWKVTQATPQYTTNSSLPRMEVGSNATALAAIERLKAKRKAEVEQKIKREESIDTSPRKDSPKGGARSGEGESGTAEPAQRNQKKVAHNAIERRYRNNINDRITALRNAVPALRELRPKKPGSSRKGKGAQEQDLVDGVPAATKLNKATILGKATEYIRYLKGRETRLVSEVAGLRELIRSLEGGEELLDLWEGEMENVVAEQEAKAKAAFALEDDSYDMDDDEDDDDDEEEDFDAKPSSRSPSNASSSSSRYMMGVFMGFSVLGGGAELISDQYAASSAPVQSAVRASSGRVLGASHQLLKRGMSVSKVKFGRVADVPHHFDHVPSHLLAVEVMRGLALLACVAFIFWPLIAQVFAKQSKAKRSSRSEKKASLTRRRKDMLGAMARSRPRPFEMDISMRKFVGAPSNAFQSGLALASFATHEALCRLHLAVREPIDAEQAAVWCRLLELETSLGPLAHRSLLARLHTLLTVGSLANIGADSKSDVAVMAPARVYGTMAIAMVRAARGHSLMISLAERRWNMARRCRLLAEEEEEEDESLKQDRWIDNVLEHSLPDAIAMCPSPTLVAATFAPKVDSNMRASLLAPLPSIAAIQHGRQLTSVWEILLSQIVKDTCPASTDDCPPTVAEFMKHHAEVKIFLSLVSTQTDQDRLSAQISRLATTAPKYECWQTMSIVTFGTWALLLGNVGVARSVAAALMTAKDVSDLPACAVAFIRLIFDGSEELLSGLPRGPLEAVNEVDALAAASLKWLLLLRRISATIHGQQDHSDEIVEKAINIRRLLATARIARNSSEETMLMSSALTGNASSSDVLSSHRDSLSSTLSAQSTGEASAANSMLLGEDGQSDLLCGNEARLDESLDLLTDVLAVLGRKAALGTLRGFKYSDGESEQHDSGVEWGI